MQHTFLGRAKSVAGAGLIGLGVFILHKNLDQAATQLNQLVSSPKEMLGVLPMVILAVLRVLQAYTSNHQQFLQGVLQHLWLTFWPLVLVSAGTTLSRDAHPGDPSVPAKKDRRIVDLTARRSTLK
jgi:hypothetical protein